MNVGQVVIWESPGWNIVKKVKTAGGGLFVGTSEHTPYIWSDCVLGKPDKYNEVHLINKDTLETDRIIKVGKTKGQLIDAKTKKVIQEWDATQHEKVPVTREGPICPSGSITRDVSYTLSGSSVCASQSTAPPGL